MNKSGSQNSFQSHESYNSDQPLMTGSSKQPTLQAVEESIVDVRCCANNHGDVDVNWTRDEEFDEEFSIPHHVAVSKSKELRKLKIAVMMCLIFFAMELVGGIVAGSLALLSDAFHLLTDVISFIISLSAIYISRWPPSKRFTFGYHRAEVMGAFLSILMIYVLTAFIIMEAVERIRNPQPINSIVMFSVAAAGVFINVCLALTLHDHHGHDHGHGHTHGEEERCLSETEDNVSFSPNAEKPPCNTLRSSNTHAHSHSHGQNINVRAAIIHILGDLLFSIGVLLAATLLMVEDLTNPRSNSDDMNRFHLADPICTFVFGLLVLGTTFPLLKECFVVFMEVSPPYLNTEIVKSDIAKLGLGFVEVESSRVWYVSIGVPALALCIRIKQSDLEGGDLESPILNGAQLIYQDVMVSPTLSSSPIYDSTATPPPLSLMVLKPVLSDQQHTDVNNVSPIITKHITVDARKHNLLIKRIQYHFWKTYRLRREFCFVNVEYDELSSR